MSRVRLLSVAFIALVAAIAVPSAKADTFVYHVTSTFEGAAILDVTFDLSSFEGSVDVTSFVAGSTLSGSPVTFFSISNGSGDCTLFGVPSGPVACWDAKNSAAFSEVSLVGAAAIPDFTGPGTFSASDGTGDSTTVTITDIPSAATPEPSTMVLLASALLGVGFVGRKRVAVAAR